MGWTHAQGGSRSHLPQGHVGTQDAVSGVLSSVQHQTHFMSTCTRVRVRKGFIQCWADATTLERTHFAHSKTRHERLQQPAEPGLIMTSKHASFHTVRATGEARTSHYIHFHRSTGRWCILSARSVGRGELAYESSVSPNGCECSIRACPGTLSKFQCHLQFLKFVYHERCSLANIGWKHLHRWAI